MARFEETGNTEAGQEIFPPPLPDGGKLLSDRSLARLLKADWPKTIDELESGGW